MSDRNFMGMGCCGATEYVGADLAPSPSLVVNQYVEKFFYMHHPMSMERTLKKKENRGRALVVFENSSAPTARCMSREDSEKWQEKFQRYIHAKGYGTVLISEDWIQNPNMSSVSAIRSMIWSPYNAAISRDLCK